MKNLNINNKVVTGHLLLSFVLVTSAIHYTNVTAMSTNEAAYYPKPITNGEIANANPLFFDKNSDLDFLKKIKQELEKIKKLNDNEKKYIYQQNSAKHNYKK